MTAERYYDLLKSTADGIAPDVTEIEALLSPPDAECEQKLFDTALALKREIFGNLVNLRGLIEFSNICTCDCLYCGIRKSNTHIRRYRMSDDEIVYCAKLAADFGYGAVVLQSGERSDREFTDRVTRLLGKIAQLPAPPAVTLSCGEQSLEVFKEWVAAGAKRYLLRIESATEEIFRRIHPEVTTFANRKAALLRIREAGFQTGTGVMIGLPGQTLHHLARDIEFFREMDIDMIGMGPFLPQKDTPMGNAPDDKETVARRFSWALRMIAVTRLVLKDVNIASTTALQTIDPENGRERGLLAGANVIMPNVGDISYRKDYQLYNGKPSLDENGSQIREKLLASLRKIGEEPRWDVSGDPPHFTRRTKA
ncbi:MAG: [Lentisphaeria bacterium]|nr:[FeFe] hydrogenase H-cluster radical SAM maturase HydE [Lentisphaeria bacterium]